MWRPGMWLAAAALCVVLSGCALTKLGEEAPAPNTYDLVAPVGSAKGQRSNVQLVVSEPSAVRALAGDNILIKPTGSEVAYFPNAVWTDQLPKLVQARLIQTIEGTGRFLAVGDGRDRLDADLELMTAIRSFQVELAGKRAVAVVDLFVRLSDPHSGRIIASRSFQGSAGAASDAAPEGVQALNEAAQGVLPAIAAWAGKVAGQHAAELVKPKAAADAEAAPVKAAPASTTPSAG